MSILYPIGCQKRAQKKMNSPEKAEMVDVHDLLVGKHKYHPFVPVLHPKWQTGDVRYACCALYIGSLERHHQQHAPGGSQFGLTAQIG